MKKISFLLLALTLICGQAFAYTITKSSEERFNDAQTGDSYKRVTGYLSLDSSHPAEGETLLPSQLGMASFTKISVDPSGPAAWPAKSDAAGTNLVRRFGYDYTANRLYVITLATVSPTGNVMVEVSGPVTYNLAYLTKVPYEAVGPIS